MAGGSLTQIMQAMILGPWMSRTEGKKMAALTSRPNQKDLSLVKELIEVGKVAPVIDRSYPLSDVAEALRYRGRGHARGKSRHNYSMNFISRYLRWENPNFIVSTWYTLSLRVKWKTLSKLPIYRKITGS